MTRPPLPRRRALVSGASAALAVAIAALGLQAAQRDPAPVAAPTTTVAPTTTTTLPPTTTTAPELEVRPVQLRTPESPPADAYANEPHVVIGHIEIPRLGLAVPLNQGISLTSIDHGPSHWPGTALPGEMGNVVVAGHRVTKTRPFHDIHLLQPGDEMILTGEHGRFVYKMSSSQIVTPDAMHIVDQRPEPTATIFACHPLGSARERYVVHFELEGEPLLPGGGTTGSGDT